ETLLDAITRERLDYPHGCTSGVCGLCKSRLVTGRVVQGDHYPSVLSRDEEAAGLILVCRSTPLSDCAIVPVQHDVDLPRPRTATATVREVRDLTHDIRLVRVSPSGAEEFRFLPGQYAALSVDGLPPRNFSMA